MNAFHSGAWRFLAQMEPGSKQWEVSYHDRLGIGRRQCFHSEDEARKFADVTGGKVAKIEPRLRANGEK